MNRNLWLLLSLALLLAAAARAQMLAQTQNQMLAPAAATVASQPSRVKDISTIAGVRDNQVLGYGIVVGLHNTGDSQQAGFPTQSLISALQRMGVNVSGAAIRVQNTAGVFVTGSLPPFAQPGTRMDVTVSSAGDAKSLEGGILLLTALYGADGKPYAAAQGAVTLGGFAATGGGSSTQVNHPTTGRIPLGATAEHSLPFELGGRQSLTFLLNEEDFNSAQALAAAINTALPHGALSHGQARALDSRRIEVPVGGEDIPALVARLEELPVQVSSRARVVINERTGTVVIGGAVRLSPVSILHGGLAIDIVTENTAVPSGFGPAAPLQNTTVQAVDKPVNRIELKEGGTVDDLVRGLQRIGATSRDVISILEAMKQAGALHADLEVI